MTDDNLIYAPFAGIIPTPFYAGEVAAPPYDVLSSAEAKVRALGNAYSFLHISKAEIDFPGDVSPYEDRVYDRAADNFRRLLTEGVLQQVDKPCYYIYQMVMGSHIQTGLAVAASVKAYDEGRIKRHELTRIAKENDRVRQIRTVGAQTGPALLVNREIPSVKALLKRITEQEAPYLSVIADHEVRHSLWIVDNPADISLITEAFAAQNEAYIADGHHRSAAAARLAAEDGTEDSARFLAVAFFADEMRIWDYNRFVHDLNGMNPREFIRALTHEFVLTPSERKKPSHKGQFMLYLNGQWQEMAYKGAPLGSDPVSKLDVSILSEKVLNQILGITDLRSDERIEFVGGIRGAEEIERLVNARLGSVGFMVYPTSVDELIAVADQKMLMPPKSTWFEPKLADGIISKPNDGTAAKPAAEKAAPGAA